MSSYREYVPAAPFMAWLDMRHDALCAEEPASTAPKRGLEVPMSPTERLAAELGWHGDAGLRRLHRYRHGVKAGSVNGRKCDRPTDRYPRVVVEDALEHAGVPFADVYPEIADAEDRPLEPDIFCKRCKETVTPIDGKCPWHDRWRNPIPGGPRRFEQTLTLAPPAPRQPWEPIRRRLAA